MPQYNDFQFDTGQYNGGANVATIKQTVCKGATDAQLRMFIEVCKQTGLPPWPAAGLVAASDTHT